MRHDTSTSRGELAEHRWMELYEYVTQHITERNVANIQYELNKHLNDDERSASLYITASQIREILKMFTTPR